MAFPPPTQATNVNNATPQQDTHPDLHNKANAAINDITDQLRKVGQAARATGDPQGATDGAYDTMFFGNKTADPLGWITGTDIQPTESGWYMVTATVQFQNTPAGSGCAVEIRRNGSTLCRADGPDVANPDITVGFLTFAGGTNIITIEGFQASGASRNWTGSVAIVRIS